MEKRTNTRTGFGKRAFALLLTLCMLAGTIPAVAFSDGNQGSGSTDEYVQEGVYNWDYGAETEHTVYYKADQYPGGNTVADDQVSYFASHCSVNELYYHESEHLWEGVWKEKTTCTDPGIYDEECLFCHAHKVTYHKPTGHQRYKMLSSTEPTCTQEGEDIYKCQWCDAKIRYSTPAKGHYWVLDEYTSKEATVWEAGHNDYKCARDGCTATRTEEIPALGGYKLPKIREKELFGDATYDQYFRTWHGVKYSDVWGIYQYDAFSEGSNGLAQLNADKYVDVYAGSSGYYNDQIVIRGTSLSTADNTRYVAVIYAQDDSKSDFGTTWCDVVVDTTDWITQLDVYLVDFGITKENGRKTKGLQSLTVKGTTANVYFVNSNIGFIDYKETGASEYAATCVMRGTGYANDAAYIVLDGYNSHIHMGPDVNSANPRAAHVEVSVRSKMPFKGYQGEGDRTTLWYNAVNPHEKYWFMTEGIYGLSFAASFDYSPTVELSNLTLLKLGNPKTGTINVHLRDATGQFTDSYQEMTYPEAILYDMTAPYTSHTFHNGSTNNPDMIQNGKFDQLSGVALYNCKWEIGTIEAEEFSWLSLSNSDISANGVSKVNLHNRARLTVGGPQVCDITAYGTNRIYLDGALLQGRITAAGTSDDIYNAFQDGKEVEDSSLDDVIAGRAVNRDYVPDPDPDKELWHRINVQAGPTPVWSYYKGANLTLFLSGESKLYTSQTDYEDHAPDIMVDNEALLYIKDDADKEGVGKISVGWEYNPNMIQPWQKADGGHYYCAAIGGTKNGLTHGHIYIESGIVEAWSFNGGAAIGGSLENGYSKNGGWISITGGIVNVEAAIGAAGIGGAAGGNAANILISGGTVNAKVTGGGAAIGGGEAVYDTTYQLVGYQMVYLKNADGSLSPIYVYVDADGDLRYTYDGNTNPDYATFTDSDGTVHKVTKHDLYVQYPGVTFETDERYGIYAKKLTYASGGGSGRLSISAGSVVNAWADNPAYGSDGKKIGLETLYFHALGKNQTERESFDPRNLIHYDLYDMDRYGYYFSNEQNSSNYNIAVSAFFYRDQNDNGNIKTRSIDNLYPIDSEGQDCYSNGRTAGYVIGSSCGEATYKYANQFSAGTGKGMNPLIIIGQNKGNNFSNSLNALADHYYLPDTSALISLDESAVSDTCNGKFYRSLVSHLTGIILVGYDTNKDDFVLTSKLGKYAYRVHGQIDLPDLGTPQTLELKEGTTLTLVNGSVMNVPARFEILQETEGQLIIEEGCVVQGKGMWPGKPADPANPPTTEQVRNILERLKTESPEEQVATHLAIVQTADGESTVIDGTSADDVRRKMNAALLTDQALLTMLSAGSYGFKKEGNVWKIKTYDPKMVVSLTENGALSASPGKYTDNTKRFDVLVTDYNNTVTVQLQSARLSTPEYKIYDGRADDLIELQLGEAGSEFSFTVELSDVQVNNNKCVFNVPKFAGSEFSLSTIKVLRSKCALRYSGTMTFNTPIMDVAGVDISELQINYSNGSKLGGIYGSGYVQIPSIAGFPVSGKAEMTLNTFAPNRELSLSVELETPIFEGAFEASFKETRGIIMIDTLYAEIAVDEGGIPLVPPTVIGYLQGGGLGFTGLADTISMDSFGAPPVRLKIAAKGSILDVIEGWARLSIGPSGFDLELTDIEIADADFIKEYGISASWDAQEKEIGGQVYWGVGADMSQYIVIGIPIKSYGGYDNSENGVIGGISATGTVEFGGFAGYRNDNDYLYFVYQLHASGSIKGSVSIPKNLIAGFPFKKIELASIDMGFYAEANATTKVNKGTVNGSAASVLRQLASSADLDINAVIGAKVTAGVGDAKCYVRLVYVLGEKGLDFSAGLGTGKDLDLSSYTGNSYSVLTETAVEGSDNPVPTIYQASVQTEAVMRKAGKRGASDTADLKLWNDKKVTATVNEALANHSIVKLGIANDAKLLSSQITVTGPDGAVTLVDEEYDDDGLPTVEHANFFADNGMICFVPPEAGTYTITINDGVNAAFTNEGEIIVTKAFATLDTANTGLVGDTNLKYKVNDPSENAKYKVQLLLGTEKGKGDYVIAETGELTASDLASARNLVYTLTGTAAASGTYYPGYLLLEYVEAQDASGQTYGTWAAVDQIYADTTVTYVNDQEIAAPENVSLDYSGNATMTANWTAVTGADAYQLTVYENTDSGLEDTGIRFVSEDNKSTSFVMDLNSLAAGKQYCVGVSAIKYKREEAGEGNEVISPDGKYQDGREGLSAAATLPQAGKPEISYSANVKTGEGNSHTMFVPAEGSSFSITASQALAVTVREKETGALLTVSENGTGDWTVAVPSQPASAGSGSDAPFILEVIALDPVSGDYVLDYITVTPDSIAPPLTIDNMGSFPKWQIESGFYATIKGQSEAGAKIYIYKYNSTSAAFEEITAVYVSDDGSFAVPVQFNGKPLFCIQAEDAAGNKSDPVSIGFPDSDITVNLNLGSGTSSVASIGLTDGSQIGELPTPNPTGDSAFTGWYLLAETIEGITTTVTNVKDSDGHNVTVGGQPVTTLTRTGMEEIKTTEINVDPGMIFRKTDDGKVTVSKLVQGTGANAGQLVEETVTTIDGNPVLYARWYESVTLSFSQGIGASCAVDTLVLAKGTAIGTLPVPVRYDGAAKAFAGWYTDGGEKVTEAYIVNGSETLTARWTDIVNVTFDPGIGGIDLTDLTLSEEEAEQFAETAALVIEAGSAIPVYPTATVNGYTFDGWTYTDGEGREIAVDASTIYSADRTLTAKWIRNVSPLFVKQADYDVTGEETDVLPDPVFSQPADISGQPSVSYTGTGNTSYLSSAKPTKPGTYKVTVQCNTAETAYVGSAAFTVRDGNAARYTVTVTAPTNGTVQVNPASAAAGETVTLSLTPDAGYQIGTVTVQAGLLDIDVTPASGSTRTFVMPNADVTVSATFTALTQPAFSGLQAVLDGEIGMRFIMTFPDGFDPTGAYMDFALSDGRTSQVTYAEASSAATGGLFFTCCMNALELSETITATFHYGNNQTVEMTYKASDYLTYLSDNADQYGSTAAEQEKLFNVVNATLNYGYYLQKSGWTDGVDDHEDIDSTDTGVATRLKAVKDETETKKIQKDLGTSGIPEENIFFSLTLNQNTVVNLYVLKSDAFTITSATLDGNAYALETVNIGGADYILVHTDPIGANKLMTDHTVVFNTASGSATITFSAVSYVWSILNSSLPANNKRAIVAFYDYAVASKAYWPGV